MYDKYEKQYIGYIYLIENLVNHKYYVGQTYVTIEHRWTQHKYSSTREDLWYSVLYKAMRKYGVSNFSIKELETIKKDTLDKLLISLNEKEKYYIQKFNSLIPFGYNMTKGGENVSIRKQVPCVAYYIDGTTYKHFDSIIEAYKDVQGNHLSDNGSTLICKCCKGELNFAYGFIWRYEGDDFEKYPICCTEEQMNRYHGEIPVKQYDLEGNLIQLFPSVKEACISIGLYKYNSTAICECCKGVIKTAYGFVWRYIKDDFTTFDSNNSVFVAVKQYTLDGNYIKTFNKISDIKKELKITSTSNISECCMGNKYSAYGYVWRYKSDSFDKFKTPDKKEKCGRKYRVINQYSKDSQYIRTFDTSLEASLFVNCKQTSITGACGRHGGGCNGFKWYYADDQNQPDKSKIIVN